MTAVVVDTDVVSIIFKGHSLADKYLDIIEGHSVVLSFIPWPSSRCGPNADLGEQKGESGSANS